MPMNDEHEWLFKEEGGRLLRLVIFPSKIHPPHMQLV